MLNPLIADYLFLDNLTQLLVFSGIVIIAGIIRGCIGFGFSAIVVASTSFWLPPVAVVNLVVLLEIAASINMLSNVRADVKYNILIPLTIGSFITIPVGTWLLATLPNHQLQWIIGIYMLAVALLTLSGFQFRSDATKGRLFSLGALVGFFNGLAAVGGIGAAWGMVGFKLPVKDIRAVLVIFFLATEVVFLLSSWGNGLISVEIIITALFSTLPLTIGVFLGTRLFTRFPEETLKKLVLVALMALSLFGIYKNIF